MSDPQQEVERIILDFLQRLDALTLSRIDSGTRDWLRYEISSALHVTEQRVWKEAVELTGMSKSRKGSINVMKLMQEFRRRSQVVGKEEGPFPGDLIAQGHCPSCGVAIEVSVGDDEGEVRWISTGKGGCCCKDHSKTGGRCLECEQHGM